jgi:hypothetical protein
MKSNGPIYTGQWDGFPNNFSFQKPEQTYPAGNFDDWMSWDDPLASPVEPILTNVKSEAITPILGTISPHDPSISTDLPFDDSMSSEPLFPLESTQTTYQNMNTNASWATRYPTVPTLTLTQRQKLQSIALSHSAPSPTDSSSDSSPEPESRQSNKRKPIPMPVEDNEDKPKRTRRVAPKKSAHNMIEKRYRTNLNQKISMLRDSVPSLRVMARKNSQGEDVVDVEDEDLGGLTPAHKLNKATVSYPRSSNPKANILIGYRFLARAWNTSHTSSAAIEA